MQCGRIILLNLKISSTPPICHFVFVLCYQPQHLPQHMCGNKDDAVNHEIKLEQLNPLNKKYWFGKFKNLYDLADMT